MDNWTIVIGSYILGASAQYLVGRLLQLHSERVHRNNIIWPLIDDIRAACDVATAFIDPVLGPWLERREEYVIDPARIEQARLALAGRIQQADYRALTEWLRSVDEWNRFLKQLFPRENDYEESYRLQKIVVGLGQAVAEALSQNWSWWHRACQWLCQE